MSTPRSVPKTDRDRLADAIRLTIEYHFGTICDEIKRIVSPDQSDALVRIARKHGNRAIDVVDNHLDNYSIRVADKQRKG